MSYDATKPVTCHKCGCANEGADRSTVAAMTAPVCARMDCPQAISLARASSKLFAAVPKRPGALFAPNLERLVVVGKPKK